MKGAKKFNKKGQVTIFVILALVIIVLGTLIYFFYPGIKIAGENLSQLTHSKALEKLQNQADQFLRNGLTYQFKNQTKIIYASWPTANADAAQQIINFHVPKTVDEAYLVGRQKGYTKNFIEQMQAMLFGKNFNIASELNENALLAAVKDDFADSITEKLDARPQIDDDFNITVLSEQTGNGFPAQQIITETQSRLGALNNKPIILRLTEEQPQIKKADIAAKEIEALANILKISSLTLTYQAKEWIITNKIFKDWLIYI